MSPNQNKNSVGKYVSVSDWEWSSLLWKVSQRWLTNNSLLECLSISLQALFKQEIMFISS